MIIIAHRGLWKNESEKNTFESIIGALSKSIGTEIDVRDYLGKIVISHDIATKSALAFDTLMTHTLKNEMRPLLAIDIKASGLLKMIERPLKEYDNYFCFGMPFTEQIDYINAKMKVFTRASEYEQTPVLYAESVGVWMDYFYDDEQCIRDLTLYTKNKKQVCIVSAELNNRNNLHQWDLIKELAPEIKKYIILCTDKYFEAVNFFGE